MRVIRPRSTNSSRSGVRPAIPTRTSHSPPQPENPMYDTIVTDLADSIFTITINRPDKLNALNTQMIHDMMDAFDRADADDAVRAIIVTGAGRAFCAGADLGAGGDTFNSDARGNRTDGIPRDGGGLLTLRIYELRKPIIAAINGPAVGV